MEEKKLFFKSLGGFFSVARNYDVYDADTLKISMECRECTLSLLACIIRCVNFNHLSVPFNVTVQAPGEQLIFRFKRDAALLPSKVVVYDHQDNIIGYIVRKPLKLREEFEIRDVNNNPICQMVQDLWWTSNRRFLIGSDEIACVPSDYEGAGVELLASANDFVLILHESALHDDKIEKMLIASTIFAMI